MRYLRRLLPLRAYSTVLPRGKVLLHDDLSVTHGQLLEATLGSHLPGTERPLQKDTPMPCGSHLVYFNHAVAEPALAADGYDNLQAPVGPTPYLRRWVGGSVTFNLSTPLKLGAPAFCDESVLSVEDSSKAKASEKLSVTIERVIRQMPASNWSIKERRTLAYFTNSDRVKAGLKRLHNKTSIASDQQPLVSHSLRLTTTLLFRYSALTFNAHRIHYDPDYATAEEGMDGPIAQGPLLVTLVLRWFGAGLLPPGFAVYQMAYKVLNPVKVGEEIELCAFQAESKTRFQVLIKTAQAAVFEADLELARQPTG